MNIYWLSLFFKKSLRKLHHTWFVFSLIFVLIFVYFSEYRIHLKRLSKLGSNYSYQNKLPIIFNFLITQEQICQTNQYEKNFIVFLINSHYNNMLRRQIMRKTWFDYKRFYLSEYLDEAEIQIIKQMYELNSESVFLVKHLFIVGTGDTLNNELIKSEAYEYRDLILINENDTYQNIVQKHLALASWTNNYCSNSVYLIKLDDDVFVNIKLLIKRLLWTLVEDKIKVNKPFLYCNHLIRSKPKRKNSSKWFISMDKYPKAVYPPYCEGYAYITNVATMRLIDKQYRSNKVPLFWIDDLYVTGMLLDDLKQVKRYHYRLRHGNFTSSKSIFTEKFFTWHINHVRKIHDNRLQPFTKYHFLIIHSHGSGKSASYDRMSSLNLLNETFYLEKNECEQNINYTNNSFINYSFCFGTRKEMNEFYYLKFFKDVWNLIN